MPFGVYSEVGKLRQVLVHRPGLEHTRLTPSNAEELFFDDVLWVAGAKAEHDMFAEAMRSRGVEVFEAETLLAQALALPEAREWVCGHILSERQGGGNAPEGGRARGGGGGGGGGGAGAGGGVLDRGDHQGRCAAGRGADVGDRRSDEHVAAAAAELLVPAGLLVLDLRRGDDHPDDQAGPPARDDDHGGDLPVPPDVHRRAVPDLA